MAAHTVSNFKYPDLFAGIGRFIQEKNLHDVCVLEFEDGIIISGSVTYEGRDMLQHAEETIILSGSDLQRLMGNTGKLK